MRQWDAEAWAIAHADAVVDAVDGRGAVDVSVDGGTQDTETDVVDAGRDAQATDDAEVVVCGDGEVCSPHQACGLLITGTHWCRCANGRWDCDGNGYGWDSDGCESDHGC